MAPTPCVRPTGMRRLPPAIVIGVGMRVSAGWELPLAEVSALCLSDGGASVIGVGDDLWCFAHADIAAGELVPLGPTRIDGRPPEQTGSEFEGVASDAAGRLYVLREGPSQILVLGPRGDIERTVELRVGAG